MGWERAVLQGGMSDRSWQGWRERGMQEAELGVGLPEKVDLEGKEAGRCFRWVEGGLVCLLAQVKGWKEDRRGEEAAG